VRTLTTTRPRPTITRVPGTARPVELPWEEGPLLRAAPVDAAAPPVDVPVSETVAAPPAAWCDAPLASLDLETTGRDPATDRILAIALFRQENGRAPTPIVDTLVDPGPEVEIPAEAAAVHGITRQRLVEQGAPPLAEVLREVHAALCDLTAEGVAVVIYNAPFDWPFLAAELARLDPPRDLPDGALVDPLVLDRHVDRYRKGKRTLEAAAEHYGVALEDAHEAAADALASLGVARAIGRTYPDIGELCPQELHAVQVQAHGVWKDSFNAYLARIGADREPVTGTWPDR
jgi:DNA polymerase III subunit epsilon